jgi:hypothetical protein
VVGKSLHAYSNVQPECRGENDIIYVIGGYATPTLRTYHFSTACTVSKPHFYETFAVRAPSPTEMSPDWQIGNCDQGSKSCGEGEIGEGERAESSKRLTAGVRCGSRSCMNESD